MWEDMNNRNNSAWCDRVKETAICPALARGHDFNITLTLLLLLFRRETHRDTEMEMGGVLSSLCQRLQLIGSTLGTLRQAAHRGAEWHDSTRAVRMTCFTVSPQIFNTAQILVNGRKWNVLIWNTLSWTVKSVATHNGVMWLMMQSQDGAQNHYRKPEQGTESLLDESGAAF